MDSPEWQRLKAIISEVIYNHDFPSEPGVEDEDGCCEIFNLFETIEDKF